MPKRSVPWSEQRKKYKSNAYKKTKYKKRFYLDSITVVFDHQDAWLLNIINNIQYDFEKLGYSISRVEIILECLRDILSGHSRKFPDYLEPLKIQLPEKLVVITSKVPEKFRWVFYSVSRIVAIKEASGLKTCFMSELMRLAEITLLKSIGGPLGTIPVEERPKVSLSPEETRKIMQELAR